MLAARNLTYERKETSQRIQHFHGESRGFHYDQKPIIFIEKLYMLIKFEVASSLLRDECYELTASISARGSLSATDYASSID